MKNRIKALIVDDEPHNVNIMKEILSFHPQYECRGATSGEKALAMLENYFPEIILLDVMMPGIDGYEVCRRIRAQATHKFSKIIMISGMSMIDDRLKGYDAGADDYLTKPYVEDELIAKLNVYSKLNRMEEVDNLKTTALNLISHETRTPLNGIILGSELLMEMESLPDKARKYVTMVRESGLKIQILVEKISKYCSLRDSVEKKLTRNSLNSLIINIINSLSKKESCDGVKLLCDCDNDITFVADWALLKDAFTYVIENSINNNNKTGVVTIKCLKTPSFINVEVRDQGPGVDASSADRMFDGLFIHDLLHHERGMGLSIAIAKIIFEEHGGLISCRNRNVCGTLFEISLKDQET